MSEHGEGPIEAFEALEALLAEWGYVAVSGTFVVPNGLITIAVGPDGRVMTVNGERVPLEAA